MKQATSMLSDAPTIISILHPQPARFASKVASWKQNSKIWKSQFLNFSGQSHRKFCPKRKFQPSLLSNIFWSYTLVHTLSNALSTTFMRHLHRAVSAFKPTCKNAIFQNSWIWLFKKTHPTQEEFRHHNNIFDFLNYYVNNNSVDDNFEFVSRLQIKHMFWSVFRFCKSEKSRFSSSLHMYQTRKQVFEAFFGFERKLRLKVDEFGDDEN